jgi:hypothetical protein
VSGLTITGAIIDLLNTIFFTQIIFFPILMRFASKFEPVLLNEKLQRVRIVQMSGAVYAQIKLALAFNTLLSMIRI